MVIRMKKLYNNSYLIISLYLLFSFFIDIITNLTIDFSLSIGMILRGILLLYLLVGLIFKYKSKENFIILGICSLFSILFLVYHHNITSLTLIIKYNFIIITILFLYNLYKKEDKKINRNILTLCLLFYSLSIIIAWLTKTALNSYEVAKIGTVGWFNSANEISAIISIILGYIFINLQKRINLIEIFTIIISLFASFLIGTRLPIIVALLCVLCVFIKKFIKDAKEKNINYTNLILFIAFLIVFAIKFKDTPIYKNLIIHLKYLDIKNPLEILTNFELFDHFIFNRRLSFMFNINKVFLSSSFMSKLFGLTYIKKNVEMDLFDLFYTYGIIGFTVFIYIFTYIIYKFKNRKDIHYLPIFIIIICSFLSGHVLLSPNVVLIMSVIIANTFYKKQSKRIIFAAHSLGPGGIEKALVNMCKKLDNKKYDITVILEKKEGIFLNEIPKNIRIKSQKVFATRFKLLNKFLNMINKLKFLITDFKEYDFSCCYATYSLSSNFIARYSSNNSAIYIHNDYAKIYENDIKALNDFFGRRKLDKFKHIVFVSNESKDNLLSLYPRFIDKSLVINNFIDNNRYLQMSKEKVSEKKPREKKLFLFVGRLDEDQKNIKRMILSFKLALEKTNKIELWLVGSGPDEKVLKELVKENKLEKNIKFLGIKKNPYPYFKLCDYFILTSNYEGFPVVYGEAITFKKKIITTIDVSDEAIKIEDNFGYICKKTEKDIADTIVKVATCDNLKYKNIDLDQVNNNKLELIEGLINN